MNLLIFSIQIHRLIIIAFYLSTTSFFIRLCGYGISIRWNSSPLFSERYGYRKVWRYKKIAVEFLNP